MSCWTCMLVTLTPWWFGPTLRHGIESSNGMHMYYNHRYILCSYAYVSLSCWGTWLTHRKAQAGNKRMLMFVDDLNMPRTGPASLFNDGSFGYHSRVEAWWKCSMFKYLLGLHHLSMEQKLQERLIWLTASLGIAATVDRLRLLVRSLEANVKAMQPQTFKHNCTRLHILCCL